MFAMSIAYVLPICYAFFSMQNQRISIFFTALMVICLIFAVLFSYNGQGHKQRIKISESAASMILVWIVLSIMGSIPFMAVYWMTPITALLETVGNLTSAGLSLLPPDSPYILKLWQSVLMWLGSFIFLTMLVTVFPEVSGCFGLDLSLSQGQIFSPMLGQMRFMARKILMIYEFITLISFITFKLAGLENWDALSMAMRCISTGGGNYFAGKGSIYVEYAATFSMLLACGNFLLYYRLLQTVRPPLSSLNLKTAIKIKTFAKSVHSLILKFFTLLRKNSLTNLKIFFSNSEVKFLLLTIFIGTFVITFTTFSKYYFEDGNMSFRLALFHIVSFISTTGLTAIDITEAPNFDRFLLFLLVIIGGCMGSVTGGLKIIRIIILFKLAAIETKKVIHPRMITNIKVNGVAVSMKIIGRVLSFFFLSAITLFTCSVILSLSGQAFSTSVAMSIACLTNIGQLPGICEAATFLALPAILKIVCCMILVIGRMEIFAFLIFISTISIRKKQNDF